MLKHNIYRKYAYSSKQKNAVALSYDQNKDAVPIVVASGTGYVAEQIIELADQADIPVYKDETAAGLLSQLELGEEIPYELYQVVAEIFSYIVKTSNQFKNQSDT